MLFPAAGLPPSSSPYSPHGGDPSRLGKPGIPPPPPLINNQSSRMTKSPPSGSITHGTPVGPHVTGAPTGPAPGELEHVQHSIFSIYYPKQFHSFVKRQKYLMPNFVNSMKWQRALSVAPCRAYSYTTGGNLLKLYHNAWPNAKLCRKAGICCYFYLSSPNISGQCRFQMF